MKAKPSASPGHIDLPMLLYIPSSDGFSLTMGHGSFLHAEDVVGILQIVHCGLKSLSCVKNTNILLLEQRDPGQRNECIL